MKAPEFELLTVPEAAELAGVSRQTIYTWMNEGYLAYERIGGTRLMRVAAVLSASQIYLSKRNGGTFRRGEYPK